VQVLPPQAAFADEALPPEEDITSLSEPLEITPASTTEQFSFKVHTDTPNEVVRIGTAGELGANRQVTWNKTYSWDISWDVGLAALNYRDDYNPDDMSLVSPNVSGAPGIPHTYAQAGDHIITIIPHNQQNPEAWLGSFTMRGSQHITEILSEFTPLMTRTQAQIAQTNPASPPDCEFRYWFSGCHKLRSTGPGFSSDWDNMVAVGTAFAQGLFSSAGDPSVFTMNPSFNLPQNLQTIGDGFAAGMFFGCYADAFTMNSVFNLPQNLQSVGDAFAYDMFSSCNGNAFNMNN
jgi:hypothetical protein